MQNMKVKRYTTPNGMWAGTIEPENGEWIAFIPEDEEAPPVLYRKVREDLHPGQQVGSYTPV